MENLREQFGVTIGELSRAWRARLNERLKPLGLSQAKWVTLLHLSRNPGGLVQTELAGKLGIEGPTLARLLDHLEADGWIRRRGSRADRRCKVVALSAKARPILKKMRAIVAGLRKETLCVVSDREITSTLAVLARLRDRLESL